jgi:pimeloyl-ACP methyl ester carboxylesterase
VAGNSLGGWVALELAAIRPPASLTLLSPAGLWRGVTPLYCRVSLRLTRWLAYHAGDVLMRLVKYRMARAVVLGQTHGKPTRLSADYARAAVAAMRNAPGYDAALRASLPRRYIARPLGGIPVTVAFGSRDRLLLARQSRALDELPRDVVVGALPRCGHVPMADDPDAVTQLIRSTAARSIPVLAPAC